MTRLVTLPGCFRTFICLIPFLRFSLGIYFVPFSWFIRNYIEPMRKQYMVYYFLDIGSFVRIIVIKILLQREGKKFWRCNATLCDGIQFRGTQPPSARNIYDVRAFSSSLFYNFLHSLRANHANILGTRSQSRQLQTFAINAFFRTLISSSQTIRITLSLEIQSLAARNYSRLLFSYIFFSF